MFVRCLAPIALLFAGLVVSPLSGEPWSRAAAQEPSGSGGPGMSALFAVDLVVPNQGYFFVVDLDANTARAVARQGSEPVPADVPRNGLVVHLNDNNDDWVVDARSYDRGVEQIRPPSEFRIWNYGGTVATDGSFMKLSDGALNAVLVWTANDLPTSSGLVDATVTFAGIGYTDGAVGDIRVGSASVRIDPGVRETQDAGSSALIATNLVVPNRGYFFVVDFDRDTVSAVAREGSAPVPAHVPQNGFVIHLNGNNDDFVVEARSYANSVETIRPTDEFAILNYRGAVAPNGTFLGFADSASNAVLIWSGSGLETARGPVNASVTISGIDFTDGAVGDIEVGSVSTTLVKMGSTGRLRPAS